MFLPLHVAAKNAQPTMNAPYLKDLFLLLYDLYSLMLYPSQAILNHFGHMKSFHVRIGS